MGVMCDDDGDWGWVDVGCLGRKGFELYSYFWTAIRTGVDQGSRTNSRTTPVGIVWVGC